MYIHVASDGAINVIHVPWFDTCTVWFVASLSYINMTLKSLNILVISCSLVQYQHYNHLALGPTALGLGDYKPDVALVA